MKIKIRKFCKTHKALQFVFSPFNYHISHNHRTYRANHIELCCWSVWALLYGRCTFWVNRRDLPEKEHIAPDQCHDLLNARAHQVDHLARCVFILVTAHKTNSHSLTSPPAAGPTQQHRLCTNSSAWHRVHGHRCMASISTPPPPTCSTAAGSRSRLLDADGFWLCRRF